MRVYEYKDITLETDWEDEFGKWYERDNGGVFSTRESKELINLLYPSYEVYSSKMENGEFHIKIRTLVQELR